MKYRWLIWGGLTSLASGSGLAETVVLKPTADTGILSFNSGNNYGKSTDLVAGAIRKGGSGRVLFRFDVAGAVPPGATVTDARLTLNVSKESSGGGSGADYELHRLSVDWSEGTKSGQGGAAAGTGESSWVARSKGTANWAVAGGLAGTDFVTAPSATQKLDGTGSYTFGPAPGLIEDVRAMLATPAADYGWMLVSTTESEAGNVRRISSRETAKGPTLTITYTPAPAIPPPVIDSFKLVDGVVELKFHAEAGNIYAVEFRNELDPAGTWTVLTNVIAKLLSFDAVATDPALEAAHRFYRLGIVAQID